jgi:hypothetical protein
MGRQAVAAPSSAFYCHRRRIERKRPVGGTEIQGQVLVSGMRVIRGFSRKVHRGSEGSLLQWETRFPRRDWVVFSKRPFSTQEEVVKYIGRYTHKVAISNNRLISMEDGQVRFKYKNYKKKGSTGYSWEEASLSAEEFIRRFLIHVLPEGFHRIRHYGFLANGRCKAAVKKIRELLAPQQHHPNVDSNQEEFIGIKCPVCKKGIMTTVMAVHRFGILVFSAFRQIYSPRAVWDTS